MIWSFVPESIAKRPLLGYGFYAFWLGMKGESARLIVGTHWIFGYAHNGILEIWLQLGLVGVVVFFITLFQAIEECVVLPSSWLPPRCSVVYRTHCFNDAVQRGRIDRPLADRSPDDILLGCLLADSRWQPGKSGKLRLLRRCINNVPYISLT